MAIDINKVSHPLLREQEDGTESPYSRDKEFTITCTTPDGEQTFELVLFYSPSGNAPLEELCIELYKEEDIFYIATISINEEAFKTTYAKMLKGDFAQFPDKVKTLIQNVETNRTVFSALFDNNTLTIKQKLQFKTVKILELNFTVLEPDDDYVVEVAQFRYDNKKVLADALESSYDELCKHVQKQNKQLYQQLVRGQDFNASRSMK
ncbi:hypothetical protein TVAG_056140 [Trichomonas vaginalis G3]|uniref:Spindle assembly abnormal protein 6 N-terminal domain-containing protein n=1 Tax=Trichomonas vaginalis (strain ATCC PRA-98 / G3) TaxID=412133 RepID=A2EL67_TRIV3|nr:assembly abnormal protein 6-related family [Trichomonas vaginalis G3]EAY06620.1 hypothetical protein TVAG_056140 [Trichomonas vaginalis G3]KAI5551662.1 assembly abnormal protein 6-related family [Trichomonas vaginalis G3]|eukprot:XP_001318843.1 hypothetical protein [Trichomonas vaginalis G3]